MDQNFGMGVDSADSWLLPFQKFPLSFGNSYQHEVNVFNEILIKIGV